MDFILCIVACKISFFHFYISFSLLFFSHQILKDDVDDYDVDDDRKNPEYAVSYSTRHFAVCFRSTQPTDKMNNLNIIQLWWEQHTQTNTHIERDSTFLFLFHSYLFRVSSFFFHFFTSSHFKLCFVFHFSISRFKIFCKGVVFFYFIYYFIFVHFPSSLQSYVQRSSFSTSFCLYFSS